jgi:hypothetical protein
VIQTKDKWQDPVNGGMKLAVPHNVRGIMEQLCDYYFLRENLLQGHTSRIPNGLYVQRLKDE